MSYSAEDAKTVVGKGWAPLVEVAHLVITSMGGTIEDVKEKYGCLRISIGIILASRADKAYDLLDCLEYASGYICETCGEPGWVRTDDHWWIKTRCDECEAAYVRDHS